MVDVSDDDNLVAHDEFIEVEDHRTLDSHRLSVLSWRFTLMLRNTFEKNFVEALQISKELSNLEAARNPSQPPVHVDAFSYVLLANQLNILKEWRSSSVDCPLDDNEAVEIAIKIESFKGIEENDEAKAFINAMKSNLARDMQNSQLRIDFAEKAAELNPQCPCWHQNLYLALRSRRRSTDYCKSAEQPEIDACNKAYELALGGHADNVVASNVIQMAIMYAELMFSCRVGSEDHRKTYEQALKFARDAVRFKPNAKIFKMRLASLLTGRWTFEYQRNNEGYDEAQRLVKEIEVGKCSSEICHKLGKYYSNPNVDGYSTAKALNWFEKALEAHIGNFPCFVDMLKNRNFRQKPTPEIIQKIDTILPFQTKLAFKCQLMFIKGFLLWSDNNTQASLDQWLTAMQLATPLKINFAGLAARNFCYIKDGTSGQALKMMNDVKFFINRRESPDSDDQSFTKLKEVVHDAIEHFEQQRRNRWPARSVRDSSRASNYEQQRNSGGNRNWRK